MPEGLSASEVAKGISEHAKHADPHERRDQFISITEAVLLSVVALLAAWSGRGSRAEGRALRITVRPSGTRVEVHTTSSLLSSIPSRSFWPPAVW